MKNNTMLSEKTMQPEKRNCSFVMGEVCRVKVLPSLFNLSGVLDGSESLSQAMDILLLIMERNLGVLRGMVNLYSRKTGKIFIHKSIGLSHEEERRGIYSPGEGITGEVVETGKAVIIPDIGSEPKFLNRTQSMSVDDDQRLSFICVPIIRGKKVLGTISAEINYASRDFLNRVLEVLTIIATMTAHAAELYLLENEERSYWLSENQRLQEALKKKYRPDNIIGDSKPMREIHAMIERIAQTRTTVLLLGESGVGKELVANAIHYASPQARGPFIKFNCAALPESLIESELFGHEKGAFTGAGSQRIGRFEEADGGTIFLDEIGELSLTMQTKLLRVLQERTFERVGGNRPIKVDIRIIAATNKDLMVMSSDGRFREDLFFRLNVFPIMIPALRERGSDIITLADHFVARFAKENSKEIKRITTPALDLLMSYHWPGNVRELENVIERATILADDHVIHAYNLPPSLQTALNSSAAGKTGLQAKLDAVAYEMIVDALQTTQGNISNAARELGITRHSLHLRMAKFDIDYRKFRPGFLEKKGQPEGWSPGLRDS
jgi:Nif-specific regulatory protein